MKKALLLLVGLLMSINQLYAQVYPVFDSKKQLYAYLTFYKVEKTGREQMRLLAKLQDVNLNQIQSTTFIGANYFGLKDMYYNGKFIFFGVTNIEGDLTEFYFTP